MKKVIITIMTIVLVGTLTLGAYAANGFGRGAGPGDGTGTGICDGTYCDGTSDGTQPRDGSGSQYGSRPQPRDRSENGFGRGAGPGDGTGTGICDGTYCDGTSDGTRPRDGSGNQRGSR